MYEADLLDVDAVSRAVEGCTGVFHVASPCSFEYPKDPEKELVLPAVQGTVNVLEAAKKFYVGRVVLTSSISAIVRNPGWAKDKVFDESSWTYLDYCQSRKKWYPFSKTLAEKAAWEFAEKHVHVNDVAEVQVLLFESPAASGRYVCTNGIYQYADFAERVSKLFPGFQFTGLFNGETQPGLTALASLHSG